MPELPEVETTRRGILPHVIGGRIKSLVVRQSRLRWPVPRDLAEHLLGQEILALNRRAKYLLLAVETGAVLMHLGMSGSLRMVREGKPPDKHDHVDFIFDNGIVLRFRDPRRFGCILWLTGDPAAHPLLAQLGPEPLSEAFDGDRLFRLSRKRAVPIKSFLMDGKVVVGVGNIYANEALFMAGVHPSRPAGRIARVRCERLAGAVKSVLAKSIEAGGTTLRDFLDGDGRPGYFRRELQVYGRGGQPCPGCGGALRESRIGQRATVFCGKCQR